MNNFGQKCYKCNKPVLYNCRKCSPPRAPTVFEGEITTYVRPTGHADATFKPSTPLGASFRPHFVLAAALPPSWRRCRSGVVQEYYRPAVTQPMNRRLFNGYRREGPSFFLCRRAAVEVLRTSVWSWHAPKRPKTHMPEQKTYICRCH